MSDSVRPPVSPVPGILQGRILEWVVISFNAWKWKVKVKSLSRVRLFTTPWTAAYQAPPSMGFFGQEYWSGVPLPPGIGFLFSTLNQLSPALSASLLVFMACSTFAELLHWPNLWGRMSNGSRPRKECHKLLMVIPRFSRFSWWNTSHFIVCLWSISSQLRWLFLTVTSPPSYMFDFAE